MYPERLQRLREVVAAEGLDACAFLPGASFYYLTGIHTFVDLLTTILLVPAADATWADTPLLLLPDFERKTTEALLPFDVGIVAYERNAEGYSKGFQELAALAALGSKRVGVEGVGFRFRETEELRRAAPGIEIVAADSVCMSLRLYKSQEEVELIRQAARITEAALEASKAHIQPGITEVELRNRFQIEALKAGAEGLGFDSLVVSGPRAALQHAAPSDRPIEHGDTVLLDVGARHHGYTADITRTFIVGAASDEVRAVYDVVRAANDAALAAAGPGAIAEDVDAAARSVIEAAGYGETFIHGTGHGLGLDVHEPPRVAVGSDAILETGMVFTIEPGIYLSGRLGIRIEDDVVITADSAERLTAFDHDLTIV